eukprot:TRINITY_DN1290_c0_g1_i1.p1 TRINITY_DN1290_c0_g1~~TRINITY_DN1290_c0_g1_i1.p1  ORF type:complete len:365 (-),score=54.96 TRINITY_DN1290_c0_g1_i1:175-1269(-)
MILAAPRSASARLARPATRSFSGSLQNLVAAFGSGSGSGSSSNEAQSRSGIRVPRWHIGIVVVPQQIAWVIERLGKYRQTLEPGLHFLVPIVDRVAYVHSLKEEAIKIPNQQAITKDNVTISIDGVLYLRVMDAYQASYGVHDPIFAVTQLAQTSMRSEIGKMTLDKTFEERDTMNHAIVAAVNSAAKEWGIQVLRYEIRDIIPPPSIKQAMEMEAEAERRRRADVLQSQGDRQSEINLAEGRMQAAKLSAKGEAEAIRERARATAEGIRLLSAAISESPSGEKAVSLRVAEQWVGAWKEMARKSNTIIVPSDPGNAASMVASAMSIYKSVGDSSTAYLPSADGSSSVLSNNPGSAEGLDSTKS